MPDGRFLFRRTVFARKHRALSPLGSDTDILCANAIRVVGRAPQRVIVIGVEGAAFGMGDPITAEVEAALDGVAESVLAELKDGALDA